jgi:hypothetical protein
MRLDYLPACREASTPRQHAKHPSGSRSRKPQLLAAGARALQPPLIFPGYGEASIEVTFPDWQTIRRVIGMQQMLQSSTDS